MIMSFIWDNMLGSNMNYLDWWAIIKLWLSVQLILGWVFNSFWLTCLRLLELRIHWYLSWLFKEKLAHNFYMYFKQIKFVWVFSWPWNGTDGAASGNRIYHHNINTTPTVLCLYLGRLSQKFFIFIFLTLLIKSVLWAKTSVYVLLVCWWGSTINKFFF